MSKRKTSSLLFSLVLTLSVIAPQAALGNRLSDASVSAASDTAAPTPTPAPAAEAETGAADAADRTQKPKKKGNAFARVLGAPFRALARLFGGGESKSETAKKASAPAKQAAAARGTEDAEPARSAAAEQAKAAGGGEETRTPAGEGTPHREAQAVTGEVQNVAPLTSLAAAPGGSARVSHTPGAVEQVDSARAAEGVRIVRPSAGEVARELQPKMWIPKIVGVPSDSVSQGRALLQHGYVQEAIAELQTAATTGLPEQLSEANNLLGLAYDRLGWHQQAAEAYGRALSAAPKDHVALTNLGYSLYLAGDYRGALKRLRQAAKRAPNEPVIFNNLGVVNARLGRYGDAYKSFARGSGEYEAHLKLAGILEGERRDREAVRHYEAALRLQPDASAVLERLVALYERTGARDKADTARRTLGQPRNPQKTNTGGGG